MSGDVPHWAVPWLDLRELAAGEPTIRWRISSSWEGSVSGMMVLAACVLVACLFCVLRDTSHYSRRVQVALCVLKLASILTLGIMFTGLIIDFYVVPRKTVAVVLDRSASMDTPDDVGMEGRSRLAAARQLLLGDDSDLLRRLSEDCHPRLFAVSSTRTAYPGSLNELANSIEGMRADTSADSESRLGDALHLCLSDPTVPAAIVMLTDGRVSAGRSLADAAEHARRLRVPLHFIALGREKPPRDARIVHLLADDSVFLGDLFIARIGIAATGLAGTTGEVSLRASSGATPLATSPVTFGADGEVQDIALSFRPQVAGSTTVSVDVTVDVEELDQSNNRRTLRVDVQNEPIRVLSVHGYPSYEFRFLKSLFARDESIDFSFVLQEAAPDFDQLDESARASLPMDATELEDHDVLIIADANPSFIPRSTWMSVASFVAERGGGLVLVAGERHLPWAYGDYEETWPLLPMRPGTMPMPSRASGTAAGWRIRLTLLGRQTPFLQLGNGLAESTRVWADLPPIFWHAATPRLKPNVQVLAQTVSDVRAFDEPAPALLSYFYGAGQVVYQATDETWRWRRRGGDKFFARYWGQLVRHIAPSRNHSDARRAQLAVDRQQYSLGDHVLIRFRGDATAVPSNGEETITVALRREGGGDRHVVLQPSKRSRAAWEANVSSLAPGTYHASVVNPDALLSVPSATFRVAGPPLELDNVRSDTFAMSLAARRSRGRIYAPDSAAAVVDALPRDRSQGLVSRRHELWNHPLLLVMFLTVTVSEWLLRKRWGLL